MKARLDYRWGLLALLSATYFLAQGTRQIYNAVLPQIKADFAASGLDDLQLGLVGSAFTLAFGLVIPFAGTLADFLRRKWIVVAGTLLFSVGIRLHDAAHTQYRLAHWKSPPMTLAGSIRATRATDARLLRIEIATNATSTTATWAGTR